MPKVLIIDYEPRGIKQLSDPLENAGYEIIVANDGIVGLEVFKKEKPDLVLIEAMLPRRHGFEVCGEMKRTEHGQVTPVVVVTSVYKGRKYRSQAVHQHGADEYLEKPIAPETLTKTVEGLLPDRPRAAPSPVAPAPMAAPVAPAPEAVTATQVAAPVATPVATPVASPVATPVATPVARPKPATAAASDATEAEIVEHLNEILGDPTGGTG
jgi:DNA-binding response OmpR family regulator